MHIGNIEASTIFIYFNDDVFVTRYSTPWKLFDQVWSRNNAWIRLLDCKDTFFLRKKRPFHVFSNKYKKYIARESIGRSIVETNHTFKCFNKSVYNRAVEQSWSILKDTSRSRFRQTNNVWSINIICNLLIRNGDSVWCRDRENMLRFKYLSGEEREFNMNSVDSVCINSCNTNAENCEILHNKLAKLLFELKLVFCLTLLISTYDNHTIFDHTFEAIKHIKIISKHMNNPAAHHADRLCRI